MSNHDPYSDCHTILALKLLLMANRNMLGSLFLLLTV